MVEILLIYGVLTILLVLLLSISFIYRNPGILHKEPFPKPKVGELIKLTWLPNPINNPDVKSCFIGEEGTVDTIDEEGLYLNCAGHMLIVGKKYRYVKNNKKELILNEKWVNKDRAWKEYPIGTKAKALMGGYWIKVKLGWKWCTGDTFPTPGGDNTQEVCLPLK